MMTIEPTAAILATATRFTMSQSKARKQAFFTTHPLCCFCGGKEAATTTDHIPARAFFYGRVWPEGYEFPACESCNQASKGSENVAAAISRCLPDPRDAKEREELRLQVEGIRNNDFATFCEMTDLVAKGRFVRQRSSVILPESYVQNVPLVQIGPLTHAHLTAFAVKLIKALHYKHTGNIAPDGATLLKSVYTNFAIAAGKGPPPSFSELPGAPKLERNHTPLRDQFEYQYGVTADKLCSIFSVRMRQSFMVGGLVNSRPKPTDT